MPWLETGSCPVEMGTASGGSGALSLSCRFGRRREIATGDYRPLRTPPLLKKWTKLFSKSLRGVERSSTVLSLTLTPEKRNFCGW